MAGRTSILNLLLLDAYTMQYFVKLTFLVSKSNFGECPKPREDHSIFISLLIPAVIFSSAIQLSMLNPLDISDLRFLIFQQLWPQDLGALRLVCKRWYPDADQEFWSHIAHIVPLLRLIPEDAWAEETIV